MGDRFVPANEKGPPRCYCKTIHEAGGDVYGYDPDTKTFLRRAVAAPGGSGRGEG